MRRALLTLLLSSCLGCVRGQLVKDEAGKSFLIKARVPVTLAVDFGRAGKPAFQEDVSVTDGSTPKDVVSVFFPVKSGAVCCDTREVSEIGGVSIDPAAGGWWMVEVNGSHNVSPFRTRVKRGDVIRWVYSK